MVANIPQFDIKKKFVKNDYIQIFNFNPGQNNFCQFLYLELCTENYLRELSMPESV